MHEDASLSCRQPLRLGGRVTKCTERIAKLGRHRQRLDPLGQADKQTDREKRGGGVGAVVVVQEEFCRDPSYLDDEQFYPLPFPGCLKGHVVGVLEGPRLQVQLQMIGQEGVYQAAHSGVKTTAKVVTYSLTHSLTQHSHIQRKKEKDKCQEQLMCFAMKCRLNYYTGWMDVRCNTASPGEWVEVEPALTGVISLCVCNT